MSEILSHAIQRCKDKNIVIPTYAQMKNPDLIPDRILAELSEIGLWDLNPRNLFRISWKNDPVESGGGFGQVNYLELPKRLTGVPARIIVLLGKYFPTGAHKVGATFGPLIEKLVTGQFDPTSQKALWPSTGNYCRGGAYNSALLGCGSIAVLPEGMSQERFDWLEEIGSEVVKTSGTESNVKEIYDETKRLKEERGEEIVVFNQFEEFGNARWHYAVTGPAIQEVYNSIKEEKSRFSGLFLTQGSAGTLASGDFLRTHFPSLKIAAGEAVQCPTLLYNGYGEHRIEGIGDKHVPWILNMKNIDMVVGIDDDVAIRLMMLFNEETGKQYLMKKGVSTEIVEKLNLLGISGIANVAGAIKMAKYYEMNAHDTVFTVGTDSMEMYQSRLRDEQKKNGEYSEIQAAVDYDTCLMGLKKDEMLELSYYDKKRMHNLKYFTWIEQQGKEVDELKAQWNDDSYWTNKYNQILYWDNKIVEFNKQTGLFQKYH